MTSGAKAQFSVVPYDAAEAAPLQSENRSTLVICWGWWTFVPIALLGAALAAPYFSTHGFVILAFVLQRGFALVCHQRPERSFWIFGAPVAVCARCLGIYVGAAIGLLMRAPRSIAMRLLIAAAVINALDAVAEVVGLHGNWMAVRFALGLLLGAAGTLLILSSMPRVSSAKTRSGVGASAGTLA
jgi:uncharacterized membrane protein